MVFGFLSWRALVLFQKHITVMATKEGAISFILWPFSLALLIGLILLAVVFLANFVTGIINRSTDSSNNTAADSGGI